jgi:hypothetical protein
LFQWETALNQLLICFCFINAPICRASVNPDSKFGEALSKGNEGSRDSNFSSISAKHARRVLITQITLPAICRKNCGIALLVREIKAGGTRVI